MDFKIMREWLGLDAEVAFCITPDLIRRAASEGGNISITIEDAIVAVTLDPDDTLYHWPKWSVPLTKTEWRKRMQRIDRMTRVGECLTHHPDEPAYPEKLAAEQVRLTRFAVLQAEQMRRSAEWSAEKDKKVQKAAEAEEAAVDAAAEAAEYMVDVFQEESEHTPIARPQPMPPKTRAPVVRAPASAVTSDPEPHGVVPATINSPLADDKPPIASDPVHTQHSDTDAIYLPPMRAGFFSIPNTIAGSRALRTGSGNKKRESWTKEAPLVIDRIFGYKAGDIVLKYDGEELWPGDVELWSKVVQRAASRPLGSMISFTTADIRKALNRSSGGTTYKTLIAEVKRLQRAHFTLETKSPDVIKAMAAFFPNHPALKSAEKTGMLEFEFNMFGSTMFSGNTYSVEIPTIVRVLFGEKASDFYEEAMYYELKKGPAKRLFFLYSRHNGGFPLMLVELQDFTGSGMLGISDFKKLMDEAHTDLVRVGFIAGFEYKPSTKRSGAKAYVLASNSVSVAA